MNVEKRKMTKIQFLPKFNWFVKNYVRKDQ